MRSTISKKMLWAVFIPFFIIIGCLSAYVAYIVTDYVTAWTELEIKGISEINAADLEGRMHSVRISVKSAAESLEIINENSTGAREQADAIVRALFNNDHVYNSWLAYEPNAFDGNDTEHTGDYPGAPSGRFICSYIMEDGEILMAPDMDEVTLDDPSVSPWYVIPRDSGALYIDVDNEIPNLYDYGIGAEPVYTLSIVAPIYKDGRVVGCVGADMIFNNMAFGIDGNMLASVAVFYPNGRIFYSQDLKFAEENLNTLGFAEAGRIKEAFENRESLFLPDEYSMFINEQCFTYFQPIGSSDESAGLFLYVATPRDEALSVLRPIFILAAVILATILAVIIVMYIYVSRSIARPLKNLTLSADAISKGYLEIDIPFFIEKNDEVGILSRALHRMVEQFRVDINRLKQTQDELTMRSQIENILKEPGGTEEAVSALATMLGKHFELYKTTIVIAGSGHSTVAYYFMQESGSEKTARAEYIYHLQVETLISGKELLFFNSVAIERYRLTFLSDKTISMCIVPMRKDDELLGYIILENNSPKKSFTVGAEQSLKYVGRILTEWIEQKNAEADGVELWQSRVAGTEGIAGEQQAAIASSAVTVPVSGLSIIEAASRINGIDVESAIMAMGGLREVYEQGLESTAVQIPESIERLDISLDTDLHAFTIDIHGLKGVLSIIGAAELADMAARIESAAKASDISYCKEAYPLFREALVEMSGQLALIFAEERDR